MSAPSFKSFKKTVTDAKPEIPGTKPSPQNFSLLTSCGLQALDTLLGGGLPVGSLLLIEEDRYGKCAEVLTKYFISEGVHCGQKIFLGSQHHDFDNLLSTLPAAIESTHQPKDKTQNAPPNEEMAIAWRYQNLKVADTTIDGKNSFGHNLQLKPPLPVEALKTAEIIKWPTDRTTPANDDDMMPELIKIMQSDKHSLGPNKSDVQVLRVALLGLGSPAWDSSKISSILYCLRSWLRKSAAVGFVTVPSYLNQDMNEVLSWIHFADICIRLDSFAGTEREKNPALKEYHGFFSIVKLPAFNSLAPHIPPSDLAYRIRRRKLVIERLSLPPELEDTTAREKESIAKTGCGGPRSTLLDF